MAGLNIDLNKEISFGSRDGKNEIPLGKRPTKTSINLVPQKESFLSKKSNVVTLALIIVLAVLLFILLVVKPIFQLTAATSRVTSLQQQLDEANKSIDKLGSIEEEYAHYTTEGMTAEELSRVDRTQVMDMVYKTVIKSGIVNSWSLSENIVTLQVTGATLEQLNQIAGRLEQEDIVDRCVINNANRGTQVNNKEGKVAVTFLVYLNDTDAAAKKAEEAAQ